MLADPAVIGERSTEAPAVILCLLVRWYHAYTTGTPLSPLLLVSLKVCRGASPDDLRMVNHQEVEQMVRVAAKSKDGQAGLDILQLFPHLPNKGIRKSVRQLVLMLVAEEEVDLVLRIVEFERAIGRRLSHKARDAATILACKVRLLPLVYKLLTGVYGKKFLGWCAGGHGLLGRVLVRTMQ